MKNWKKIVAVLMVIAVAGAVLAACTKGQNGGETTTAAADTTVATAEKETLVMATNAEFPPYEFHEGDAIVGIDAEVAQAIADKLGMELKIEDVAFDSIIPGVQAGSAISIASYTSITSASLQPCSLRIKLYMV